MRFNAHPNLVGSHAFLSASKWHWLNYDDEKLIASYNNSIAAQRGTELHKFAADAIRLNQRMARSEKTMCSYVNDAIGFRMRPEQVLCYNDICFGTADAISFRNNMLRIHDLKTGVFPAHMEQLYIYAAMFCLEYGYKPKDIQVETRIYQNDDILIATPGVDTIAPIMDKIKHNSELINKIRMEEY